MSSTNGTSNPFASDPTGAQAGLYKGIGVALAIASGLFIGSSFVFKKKGLLQSIEKSGGIAGEGYTYLKSAMWWTGMILMIVGELCNFIAYAFTQAILVTPLGALSVVISAVLSSIFLKEKLSFQGKIGCLQCILGAVIIVLHAPEQSAADTTIETFKHHVLSIGFLVYAGLAIVISLFLVFYCGPRWGKKNMLVYICICSLIGSISVVFTQGLGSAIVHSITAENQFTNWFIYLVLAITVITLVIEIVYLNKALNLFNTALVTPTYYVIFTTMTIVSSIVLYRGFDASGVDVATCVIGFLCICSGVALLHNSNSQPISIKDKIIEKQFESEDEKVLLQENNTIKRQKSVFEMFESKNENNIDIELGAENPNAADLFPAPFSGISRYASSTKRTHSIIHKALQEISNGDIQHQRKKTRPHSNTISVFGEDGYHREMRWRDYPTKDISADQTRHVLTDSPLLDEEMTSIELETKKQDNEQDKQQKKTSIYKRNHSSSTISSHRAQNELDPLTSFRKNVHNKGSEDSIRLVDDWNESTH